jgi:type VI secretion system protein ImpB
MPKEQTVAPRERVNITYKPATGDQKEEVELPFKMVMLGDYTLREDDRPLEERKPINVDKDNFNEVMKKQDLKLTFSVPDKLSGKEDEKIAVNMKFDALKDFSPDAVAEQVPELKKLLELRNALQALKGPLGNMPAFRKKLQSLLKSEAEVDKLLKELGAAGGEAEKSEGK